MMPLQQSDIGTSWRDLVSKQDYSKQPTIDGIKIVDLGLFGDDGGAFTEVSRLNADGSLVALPQFHVRQINYSEVLPGAVKAFHLHFNQEDVWFVPPSNRLLVGLLDARENSPTIGLSMRFVLGGGRCRLLYIPRGVAHGAANPWMTATQMFYLVNQQFRADDTDERRLPWDLLGANFWEVQKG